jgi:hypothetical protein
MPKLNKKQQRINYLSGIYNALNRPTVNVTDLSEGVYSYDQEKIKQVLATLKNLLADDNIRTAE